MGTICPFVDEVYSKFMRPHVVVIPVEDGQSRTLLETFLGDQYRGEISVQTTSYRSFSVFHMEAHFHFNNERDAFLFKLTHG